MTSRLLAALLAAAIALPLPASVAGAEPPATAEPAVAVEPPATAEPAVAVEPVATAEPAVAVEPVATVEPAVAVEPTAEPAPAAAAIGRVDALIVRYRPGIKVAVGGAAPGAATAGVALRVGRAMAGGFVRVELPQPVSTAEAEAIVADMAADPAVLSAEPDLWMTIADDPVAPFTVPSAPDDTYYDHQAWHYDGSYGIGMLRAWEVTRGSSDVTVAVVDTGVTAHPDLDAAILGTGADLITNAAIANDGGGRDMNAADPGDWVTAAESSSGLFAGCPAENSSWHGTHVAGTIAAAAGNGIGVTGVAPGVRVLPVRVMGKCGGFLSDVIDGVRWAAGLPVAGVTTNTHPADVISLSLGGSGSCSPSMQLAIDDALTAGSIVVVAAGNANVDVSGVSPASCTGVIAVAASDAAGTRAAYSNYGPGVTLAAPGGDGSDAVWSTLNTGALGPASPAYAGYQGTSMATPHVSAVVALMTSVRPGLTPAEAWTILTSTAAAFPAFAETHACSAGYCGAGILDGRAAVAAAMPAKMPQTIDFAGLAEPVIGATVTLAATASSGLPVSFSLDTSAACTLAGADLHYASLGACTVRATSPGNDVWAPAEAAQTVGVRLVDTITLEVVVTSATYGDAPVGVVASAASGLPVTVSAGPSGVCTYDGGLVTLNASGTCMVTATTGGDATYAAAAASASIDVALHPAVPPGAVAINSGASATRSPSVRLSLTWPAWATSAQVSSSSTFAGATTISPRTTQAWTVTPANGTKRVYLRFRAANYATSTVSDAILLDRTVPKITGSSARVVARRAGSRTVSVRLVASGTGSQIASYQVTSRTSRPGTWRTWTNPFLVSTGAGALYVRIRDAAGNVSSWRRFVPPR